MVERRRLKRKLSFWRIAAILSVILLVVGLGIASIAGDEDLQRKKPHIAKITVDGIILDEKRRIDLIRKVKKSKYVKGVLLSINSPGGATSGGEALYEELTALAKEKPLVASMDNIAASAGYMIALPAERIFARRNTLTGSIGVVFQYTDFTTLMETVGVEMRMIKSSPLKAEPNPFTKRNPEAEAMMAKMIEDSYQWFVGLVDEHRPFDKARALELADGRVVTGGQALDLELIDELGGPEAAKNWLIKEHDLSTDFKLIEWKPAPLEEDLPFGFASKLLANWLPRPFIELFAQRNQIGKLDGLVSVWQAQKNK